MNERSSRLDDDRDLIVVAVDEPVEGHWALKRPPYCVSNKQGAECGRAHQDNQGRQVAKRRMFVRLKLENLPFFRAEEFTVMDIVEALSSSAHVQLEIAEHVITKSHCR